FYSNTSTSCMFFFFFSSRRRHTRSKRDWSSDVCSSDLYSDHRVSVRQDHRDDLLRARAPNCCSGCSTECSMSLLPCVVRVRSAGEERSVVAGKKTCGCGMSRRRLFGTAGAAATVTAASACQTEAPAPQEVRRGHVVGQTTDVPDGGGAVFSHSKLVVTQPEEGEYKAFSAQCTHGGCTVQEVEDEVI